MSHFSSTIKLHGVELQVIGSYSARCGRYTEPDDYNEIEDITAIHVGDAEVTAIIEASAELWAEVNKLVFKAVFDR